MLQQSELEHQEICERVQEASSSVMRYSSLVVAVSGGIFAAIIQFNTNGMVAETADQSTADNYLYPLSLIILANITLLIQLIINYKCSSHNRLAAYRNLISSETEASSNVSSKIGLPPATGFDVCMDHLNATYADNFFDFSNVSGRFFERRGIFARFKLKKDDAGKDIADDRLDRFVARAFPSFVKFHKCGLDEKYKSYGMDRHDSDVMPYLGVFPMLLAMMVGFYPRKGTWQFPNYVNRMIVFIVLMELIVAGNALYNLYENQIFQAFDPHLKTFLWLQIILSSE